MVSDSENLWRGTSPEERADDRRDRLIAAGLDIIARDGTAGLGVRAVCRAANVSHRYFYEWFADTDALLLAAYQRAVHDLLSEVGTALTTRGEAKRGARERLRLSFDAATGFLERHPAEGRLIFQEALANEVLRRHAVPALPAFLHAVRGMAVEGADTAPAEPLQTALISGGLAAIFIEWLSGTAQFTRDELVDYCTEAMLAVLSLTRPAPRG